jgi:hypothetical protein
MALWIIEDLASLLAIASFIGMIGVYAAMLAGA